MADDVNQTQSVSEVIAQLQNIARQLSAQSQSITNVSPAATTTTSPKFTAITLGTGSITVLVATSTLRHGLLLHNPGTATCYIFQTGMASSPTTSSLGGSVVIYPGGTFALPSAMFANINAGFSGFAGTGSSNGFTVVEFF